MPVSNLSVDLLLGNVDSTIRGPAPIEALDRALNRGLPRTTRVTDRSVTFDRPLVFDPLDATFLTGALSGVKSTLRDQGVRYRIQDTRPARHQPQIDWQLRGHALRPYQEDVVRLTLERGSGVIDIGTGGGKTLLAAAVIASLGLPTLYLVTTRTLLEQTVRELRAYLGIDPGVIGDGVRDPKDLTVALAQVLARPTVDLDAWADGTLVFDEGHHAAATSYFRLIRNVRARFNFFLSAVPFRAGPDQAVFDALTGGRLTDGAYSARYLVEHGYACPVEVKIVRCRIRGAMTGKPFWKLYDEFIVKNTERNRIIVEHAREQIKANRSVLVLVDRKQHGELLLERLGDRAAFVHGEQTGTYLQDTMADFTKGWLRCLIATSGLFHEGVSIGGIEALIQAGGLKSRSKVIQSIGRGMRKAPGKERCLYLDFFDDDSAGVLRTHSVERFKVLAGEGFRLPASPRESPPPRNDEPIPAAWTHDKGTREFRLVDEQGITLARARCLRRRPVPDELCEECEQQICEQGGEVTWRGDTNSAR